MVLIFIPPSETKAFPAGSAPVELGSLALPGLRPVRARLLSALTRLSRGRKAAALEALGLSEGQAGELAHNRGLRAAPAGPAAEVYTGVLYDALDLPALRRQGVATDQVLIFSGLWGVVRPGDRIPHYRCSAGVKLPSVGSVSAAWRKALAGPLAEHAGGQLVVDLRSGAYASLWAPRGNGVTVRVLHEREAGGVVKRAVVSHFNKATKGRLARALLESGQQPGKPEELADLVRALGYTVEPGPAGSGPDAPAALDIVVREL
ncbi:MAG: YaaA family protein [Trebonia sp.]